MPRRTGRVCRDGSDLTLNLGGCVTRERQGLAFPLRRGFPVLVWTAPDPTMVGKQPPGCEANPPQGDLTMKQFASTIVGERPDGTLVAGVTPAPGAPAQWLQRL